MSASPRTQVSARHSLQWSLVGVQVAQTVTLMAGAGLLVRSSLALARVDPGFDTSRVLAFRVAGRFGDPEGLDGLVRRINTTIDELEALPGIEAAANRGHAAGRP